jgi:site-specific recombinase XerD
MADNGCGIKEIQELLDHASLSTTAICTYCSTGRLQGEYRNASGRH